MNPTYKFVVLILLGFTVLAGCKKETVDLDMETGYFGLEKGRYVDYDVTYMFHDSLLQKHDTLHYQIRTEIGDTFMDNSGRVAREFHRFMRLDASHPWVAKDIWIAIIDGVRAELVEENQRLIKLVFKPTEDKTWNINAFNNMNEMIASYAEIGESKEINGLSFPETVTVDQEDYKTLIDLRRQYEVYAKGVGMIQKHYQRLEYKFGSSKPVKGEEYFYNVIDYGTL